MATDDRGIDHLARCILAAADGGVSIPPFTEIIPSFSLEQAYQVSARIAVLRQEQSWNLGKLVEPRIEPDKLLSLAHAHIRAHRRQPSLYRSLHRPCGD
jgi:hypothetical protein